MAKFAKKIIKCLAVCLIVSAVCLVGFNFSTETVKAEDTVLTLKKGNYAKWIDRVNFGEYKEMARSFYEWLIENSDNDGVDDALIDHTDAECFEIKDEYGNPTGEVQYVYTFNVFEEEVYCSSNNPNNVISPIAQQNMIISQEVMTTVFAAFNRDNPQVFWLSGDVNYGDYYVISQTGNTTYKYTQKTMFIIKSDSIGHDLRATFFPTEDSIRTAISAMNDKVEEIVGGISEDATDYEKVKYFNHYLIYNNCYRKYKLADDLKLQSHVSYFALFGREGDSEEAPVCEGYARSFKVLCDRAGIDCVLEDGDAGEAHMWDIVKIDGIWYYVDVTWNDPTSSSIAKVSGNEREIYLLVGSETVISGSTFASRHKPENAAYSGIICFLNGPKVSTTAYESGVVKSWDISKTEGEDSITATLYKSENYTEEDPSYELVILGEGKMKDFTSTGTAPWSSYRDGIEKITVRGGVAQLGNYAFTGCNNLTEIVIAGYGTKPSVQTFYGVDDSVLVKAHDACPVKIEEISLGIECESLCEYGWSQKSEATCTQAEILVGECVCGSTTEKEGNPKTEHNFNGEYEYTDDGHWQNCVCGEDGPITAHTYGNWVTNKQPTYTEKGEKTRTCVCGKTEKIEIDMLERESTPSSEESVVESKDNGESNGGNKNKKGCKNSIGGSGIGLLALAFGVTVIRKKK